MRKIRLIKFALVVILALAASSLANAGIDDKPAGAAKGIKKTRHNLSNWGLYEIKSSGTERVDTQVCIFCHTPHNADSSVVPLWGHKDTTATGFQMASSYYVKPGAQGYESEPTGISKKCLSCHDGTVAIGALAGRDITMAVSGWLTAEGKLDTDAKGYIGTNLTGGHVISFNYDNAFSNASTNTKLKSRASMSAADQKSMFDRQGRMQCHSCHDPHTDWCDDPNKTVGPDPLWRKKCTNGTSSGQNSSVCEVCHKTTFSGYTQAFPYGPP